MCGRLFGRMVGMVNHPTVIDQVPEHRKEAPMTTISTSIDTGRTGAHALRAALVALAVVALLAGVFLIGRVLGSRTPRVPPHRPTCRYRCVRGGSAACNLGPRSVTAC